MDLSRRRLQPPPPQYPDLQRRIVVRPHSGRLTLGVVLGVAALVVVLTVWNQQWQSLPQVAAMVALLAHLVWWWFDASSLRLDAHGVTIDNPLRWTHLPWTLVRGAHNEWGLRIDADRSRAAWAVPASAGIGVGRSHDASAAGRNHVMPTATAAGGPLPTLFGAASTVEVSLGAGAAARLVEECRLELDEHRQGPLPLGEARVSTGVHWSRFGVALALAVAVWLTFMLGRV